jgi:hypothetical protein
MQDQQAHILYVRRILANAEPSFEGWLDLLHLVQINLGLPD